METKTAIETRLATSPAILGTLASFGAHLAGRKVRDRTVDTYVEGVRRFAAYLGDESTVAGITAESIGRYQLSRRNLAAATLGKDLSAIRSYSRWCIRALLRQDDPTADLEFPKRRRRLPRPLKHE